MYVVGMQEYIEAVAVWHYISKRNIISLNDVQERLTFTQACFIVECCEVHASNKIHLMFMSYKDEHFLF